MPGPKIESGRGVERTPAGTVYIPPKIPSPSMAAEIPQGSSRDLQTSGVHSVISGGGGTTRFGIPPPDQAGGPITIVNPLGGDLLLQARNATIGGLRSQVITGATHLTLYPARGNNWAVGAGGAGSAATPSQTIVSSGGGGGTVVPSLYLGILDTDPASVLDGQYWFNTTNGWWCTCVGSAPPFLARL